jgi:hypothetical protein
MSSSTPASRGAAPFVLPLYALTLFLSAFLLFAVQPLFTKMVLPLLGGSAAVWNTAMVFFQATLLAGYAYAHLSTRFLGPKQQVLAHGAVLLTGILALPLGVASGWTPPAGGAPIPWLIALLAVSIGLPFFAVSATAPLLQKWFAHTDHAAASDPYFLYGASNLGSLAALLSYPLLIEPALGLRLQSWSWTAGYGLLALAIATCGFVLVRRHRSEAAEAEGAGEQGLVREVTWLLRARWLALAVVPSALLMGVTLHIGTEVAAVPLLWVLPLAAFLLTFVVAFARRPWIGPAWWRRGQVLFVVLVAAFFQTPLPSAVWSLPLHIGAMFFTALVCHGELARLRPAAKHLTEFYLWMSVGGVLGGALASIVAPQVFDSVLEYPLALFLGLCLRPPSEQGWLAKRLGWTVPRGLRLALDLALPALLWFLLSRQDEAHRNAWELGVHALLGELREGLPSLAAMPFEELAPRAYALSIALAYFLLAPRPLRMALGLLVVMRFSAPDVFGSSENRLMRARSFFGVYSVKRLESPVGTFHLLYNGGVLHGGQNMDRPLGPVTYYTREGPVGQILHVLKDAPRPVEHIGVIGLGVGAVAPFLGHGQRITYFEIDPLDEEIARDRRCFTYLADAGDKVQVKIGDGRLLLEGEPDESFQLLLVAAFSGDAIPVHLLTREALAIYARKLSPGGVMLFNVTNAYLDLLPVMGRLADELGLVARYSSGYPTSTPGGVPADYVALAKRPEVLARLAFQPSPWPELATRAGVDLWTDDFSNIFQVLRWDAYGFGGE